MFFKPYIYIGNIILAQKYTIEITLQNYILKRYIKKIGHNFPTIENICIFAT